MDSTSVTQGFTKLRQGRLWKEVRKYLATLFAVGSYSKTTLDWRPRYCTKCFALPEFALQGADFSIHCISCFSGILQLTLELPTGCIGSLGLLFCFLKLAFQLLQAHVCLVRLSVYGKERSVFPQSYSTVVRAAKSRVSKGPSSLSEGSCLGLDSSQLFLKSITFSSVSSCNYHSEGKEEKSIGRLMLDPSYMQTMPWS